MAWEYPTNFSNGTSVDGMGSFFTYMNYATGDWFATGVIFVIFMMAFIATSFVSFRKALASASFIAMIFSSYFVTLGIISMAVPFTLLAIFIIGVILSKSENANY